MIVELNNNRNVFQQLQDSKYKFGLTGSNFFRTATPNPDTDLYASYSPEILHYLKNLGFVTKNEQYPDSDCVMVVHHHEENIDVQLRKDFEHYTKARNIIANSIEIFGRNIFNMTKSQKSDVWNRALHIARKS